MDSQQSANGPQDEAEPTRRGVLGGAAAILREILATPRVGAAIRVLLSSLDPEHGADVVRALLRTDPALFLDLAASVPRLANASAHAALALGEHLSGLPAGLVEDLGPSLLAEVPGQPIGEAAAHALIALGRLVGPNGHRLDGEIGRIAAEARQGIGDVLAREGVAGAGPGAAIGLALIRAGSHGVRAALDAAETPEAAPLRAQAAQGAAWIGRLPETHPRLVREVLAPLGRALRAVLATE